MIIAVYFPDTAPATKLFFRPRMYLNDTAEYGVKVRDKQVHNHTSMSMKHVGPLPDAGGKPEAEMYFSSSRCDKRSRPTDAERHS